MTYRSERPLKRSHVITESKEYIRDVHKGHTSHPGPRKITACRFPTTSAVSGLLYRDRQAHIPRPAHYRKECMATGRWGRGLLVPAFMEKTFTEGLGGAPGAPGGTAWLLLGMLDGGGANGLLCKQKKLDQKEWSSLSCQPIRQLDTHFLPLRLIHVNPSLPCLIPHNLQEKQKTSKCQASPTMVSACTLCRRQVSDRTE